MTPLIQSDEDIVRLREIAQSWHGTPWCAEGAVKGTGASCTGTPHGILAEFGHEAPLPPSRHSIPKRYVLRTIQEWIASHPEHYTPVDFSEVRPGDVLLFKFGIGHMALSFGGTEIFHSWQTAGAHFSNYADESMGDRLVGAWRPIKP